jgi:hypothetical protein
MSKRDESLVSGHDFSRADAILKNTGFSRRTRHAVAKALFEALLRHGSSRALTQG